MLNLNSEKIAPYIILSVLVHFLVFFVIFYQKKDKNVFMQIPLEVSFYSPVQEQLNESKVVQPVEKAESIKNKQKEKAKNDKDDIAVSKKDKKKPEEIKKDKEETQAKKDQQVPESGSVMPSSKGIMIENADFKYSYYTSTIVKKIGRYWQWSSVSSSLRAVIYFKIARDGSVYSVYIKESSKNEVFDQNALRTVQLAAPFAPLPEGYKEDNLGVYFEFKFR